MRTMSAIGDEAGAPPTARTSEAGRAVVGVDGFRAQRQQRQHDPRRATREPGSVEGPALASLQLGARPGVLSEERGQGAEQPSEVVAPHLSGHAQRLDDAVADRVGEGGLESVEALVEATSGAVVLTEARERLAQVQRSANADLAQCLRQRQPRAHAGGQVVDDLRPQLAQLGPSLALAAPGRVPRATYSR